MGAKKRDYKERPRTKKNKIPEKKHEGDSTSFRLRRDRSNSQAFVFTFGELGLPDVARFERRTSLVSQLRSRIGSDFNGGNQRASRCVRIAVFCRKRTKRMGISRKQDLLALSPRKEFLGRLEVQNPNKKSHVRFHEGSFRSHVQVLQQKRAEDVLEIRSFSRSLSANFVQLRKARRSGNLSYETNGMEIMNRKSHEGFVSSK